MFSSDRFCAPSRQGSYRPRCPPSTVFPSLRYQCVPSRPFSSRRHLFPSVVRCLLNDISGWVVPGKLTALMGGSGAGKVGPSLPRVSLLFTHPIWDFQTTLLNVLAHTARSPLADASFGPADMLKEEKGVPVNGDPFSNEHTPRLSPIVSSTFCIHGSNRTHGLQSDPRSPFPTMEYHPKSVGTQLGEEEPRGEALRETHDYCLILIYCPLPPQALEKLSRM